MSEQAKQGPRITASWDNTANTQPPTEGVVGEIMQVAVPTVRPDGSSGEVRFLVQCLTFGEPENPDEEIA